MAEEDAPRRQSIVSVTSKPRQQSDKGLISVESWTSHDDGNNNTTRSFAIYVKVQRGQSPVAGAKVTARLEVLHINGTTLEFAPLELLDDGFAGKFSIECFYILRACRKLYPHVGATHTHFSFFALRKLRNRGIV